MTHADEKLEQFFFNNTSVKISFVETQTVEEGVECDIYTFVDDKSKDLAIVRVKKDHKTPLQRVLLGTETIEGFVRGTGSLSVDSKIYNFGLGLENKPVTVNVGQTMQWHAENEDLTFYEICDPPYADGRFEDLSE